LTEYSQTDHFSRGSIVESTHWKVLHRPVELAAYTNSMAGMFGHEPGEILGRSVFDSYLPEDIEHKRKGLARRREGLGKHSMNDILPVEPQDGTAFRSCSKPAELASELALRS
jgi:hypothetical protein